ncbi:hypothetical protein GYMLUDRAFT_49862 [Collybiopsis luxurians FD-317 M1]|uniref:HD domain-containing protein n=1 Tax=Collybiopsis luxurians FD-317 M1 TaxID=944289 RepID=A0A0D0AQ94_9AGAR|nr:hypothetical protein GYMLUDRAFT_49862 [Collybiopsis luxurians FD-317 M1]
MLSKYGVDNYMGERVQQIEHCLQAANSAREAGAADTTIIAALLHDCGHILPQSILDAQIRTLNDSNLGQDLLLPSGKSVGRRGHDVIGGAYLASLGFPSEVCELVRDHVVAKRYLTATEEGYYDSLSEASKRSLEFQGGPFSPPEVEKFKKDPLFQEKVQMRRFDDAAKVPGLQVPSLDSYKELTTVILQRA